MPEEPFSILDKVNYVTAAGFKRLLIDFSKTKVTKGQIKSLMLSMTKGQPLPGISRFNWKDGFYSPKQMEEYKASAERAQAAKEAKAGGGANAGNTFRNGSNRPSSGRGRGTAGKGRPYHSKGKRK